MFKLDINVTARECAQYEHETDKVEDFSALQGKGKDLIVWNLLTHEVCLELPP